MFLLSNKHSLVSTSQIVHWPYKDPKSSSKRDWLVNSRALPPFSPSILFWLPLICCFFFFMIFAEKKFWATEENKGVKMSSQVDEWMKRVEGGKLSMLITSWWVEINESVVWQDAIFFTLSALFALVSSVALVNFSLST